jgi:hypothetical protein
MPFDIKDLDVVIALAANPNATGNQHRGCRRRILHVVAGVSDLRTGGAKRGRLRLLPRSGRTRPMNAGCRSTQLITSHPGDYIAYLLRHEHQPFQDLAL